MKSIGTDLLCPHVGGIRPPRCTRAPLRLVPKFFHSSRLSDPLYARYTPNATYARFPVLSVLPLSARRSWRNVEITVASASTLPPYSLLVEMNRVNYEQKRNFQFFILFFNVIKYSTRRLQVRAGYERIVIVELIFLL